MIRFRGRQFVCGMRRLGVVTGRKNPWEWRIVQRIKCFPNPSSLTVKAVKSDFKNDTFKNFDRVDNPCDWKLIPKIICPTFVILMMGCEGKSLKLIWVTITSHKCQRFLICTLYIINQSTYTTIVNLIKMSNVSLV